MTLPVLIDVCLLLQQKRTVHFRKKHFVVGAIINNILTEVVDLYERVVSMASIHRCRTVRLFAVGLMEIISHPWDPEVLWPCLIANKGFFQHFNA